MTHDDKKLLELAAKAAGIADGDVFYDMDRGSEWNPLYDDGDALRLAVKLGMGITTHAAQVDCPDGHGGVVTIVEQTFRDAASVRRAIVRAAAAIEELAP